MACEGGMRHAIARLPLKGGNRGPGAACGNLSAGMPPPPEILPRFAPDIGGSLSRLGRWQWNARASGLREADGDGLLGRARAVFSGANLTNFLANKFSGLRGSRFGGVAFHDDHSRRRFEVVVATLAVAFASSRTWLLRSAGQPMRGVSDGFWGRGIFVGAGPAPSICARDMAS